MKYNCAIILTGDIFMSEIIVSACIPSLKEHFLCSCKFKAFTSASPSPIARSQGAMEDSYFNAGSYPLRTAFKDYEKLIFYVESDGSTNWNSGYVIGAGLRIALQLVYNPHSPTVKSCKFINKAAKVWNKANATARNQEGKYEEVTSCAPIIIFGKNKYIWLNKTECEAKIDTTMKCLSLELLECAVPFDSTLSHNDFGKATGLIEQCNKVATENCSDEELKLLVKVKLSDKDGYSEPKPQFTDNQLQLIKNVKNEEGKMNQ